MNQLFRFGLLFLGCFLLTMAFVPLVTWATVSALVNFYPTVKVAVPSMDQLVSYNLLYSAELALGLLCIRKALK